MEVVARDTVQILDYLVVLRFGRGLVQRSDEEAEASANQRQRQNAQPLSRALNCNPRNIYRDTHRVYMSLSIGDVVHPKNGMRCRLALAKAQQPKCKDRGRETASGRSSINVNADTLLPLQVFSLEFRPLNLLEDSFTR